MEINTGSILIDARTAEGTPVSGVKASYLLYNQRLRSLDAAYRLKLGGAPTLLAEVPAFPYGLAELVMELDRYCVKRRFVNVQAGEATEIQETFFLDARRAKAKFPSKSHPAYSRLAIPYSGLSDLQKAGLLNIHAKLASLGLGHAIESVVEVRPARIFATVKEDFLDQIRDAGDTFEDASGISHTFPKSWRRIELRGSFKSRERQANLQMTFATNSDNQLLVDFDIDDHKGIAHAFDVIGHSLTGSDTHPYNIHQVMTSLQGIHPGYTLS